MSLAELELSVRATNCLESEGITTVRHLVSRTEDQLLNVRNFGETTLKEVRAKLHEIGLDLGMNVPTEGLRAAAKWPVASSQWPADSQRRVRSQATLSLCPAGTFYWPLSHWPLIT